MKTRTLFAAVAVLIAAPAFAADITALAVPAGIARPPSHDYCAARAFDGADKIIGVCKDVHESACSGRGCQPVTITTFYNVVWSAGGVAPAASVCYTLWHHAQSNVYTDANGQLLLAAPRSCPFVLATGTVVYVDGVPYWYAATSADGAYEIVNTQYNSVLLTF